MKNSFFRCAAWFLFLVILATCATKAGPISTLAPFTEASK